MEAVREDVSLLDALREDLGVRSVKDGCSPQGQCGCCTVLVDGAARVACVTPVRRVAGRDVRTVDGIDGSVRDRLVPDFVAHGAAQCGFCTPGIICRLAALGADPAPPAKVETALLAHLCRCTGWRSVVDAATAAPAPPGAAPGGEAAARRAAIEGGVAQSAGPDVVAGRGGFADDTAPAGCLVAVPVAGADPGTVEGWSVAATLAEARAAAGKVQGRRSGQELAYPLDVPPGDWDVTLQTTWVEPAYLEPDASWCEPGREPASAVGNGGAFGGKTDSVAPAAARLLADHLGRPVRVVLSREDVVRLGPKRPPIAAGLRSDGTGVVRIAGTDPALAEAVRAGLGAAAEVELVAVTGPAVSAAIRAAGWAEGAVLAAAVRALDPSSGLGSTEVDGTTVTSTVTTADGGSATARVAVDATAWPRSVEVSVSAGEPLDAVTLRSYVQGAAHMALGWVCSEGIAVGPDGVPDDLTIRSFGILRAKDTPPIEVAIAATDGPPVRVSDAAFAAVAAATWLAQGLPSRWPTRRGTRR